MISISECKQSYNHFKVMSDSGVPTTIILLIKAYIASIIAIQDRFQELYCNFLVVLDNIIDIMIL